MGLKALFRTSRRRPEAALHPRAAPLGTAASGRSPGGPCSGKLDAAGNKDGRTDFH